MNYEGENGFIYIKTNDENKVICAEDIPDKHECNFKNMLAYIVDFLELTEEEIRNLTVKIGGIEHGLEYYIHDVKDSNIEPTYLELKIWDRPKNKIGYSLQNMEDQEVEKIIREINNA